MPLNAFLHFACFIILLTGSFVGCKVDKAPLQKPDISVTPAVVSRDGKIDVHCEPPEGMTSCSLYQDKEGIPIKNDSGPGLCTFHVTWAELLRGQTDPEVSVSVELSCDYANGEAHSDRSEKKEVKVIGKLKSPQLTVKPSVIREGDSVELHCVLPPSLPVTRCYFLIGRRQINQTSSTCQHTLSWTALLKQMNHSSDNEIKVQCWYSLEIGGHPSPSPLSNFSIVTLLGFTVSSTVHPVAASVESTVDPASDKGRPNTVAITVRVVCTVVVILLGVAAFSLYRRHSPNVRKAVSSNNTPGSDMTLSLTTDTPTADRMTRGENNLSSLVKRPDYDNIIATFSEPSSDPTETPAVYSSV